MYQSRYTCAVAAGDQSDATPLLARLPRTSARTGRVARWCNAYMACTTARNCGWVRLRGAAAGGAAPAPHWRALAPRQTTPQGDRPCSCGRLGNACPVTAHRAIIAALPPALPDHSCRCTGQTPPDQIVPPSVRFWVFKGGKSAPCRGSGPGGPERRAAQARLTDLFTPHRADGARSARTGTRGDFASV